MRTGGCRTVPSSADADCRCQRTYQRVIPKIAEVIRTNQRSALARHDAAASRED